MGESVSNMQFAPFRPMDDFLLDTTRYKVPELNDPAKINNRMVNNLIYYQTNYLVAMVVLFLLIGYFSPGQMMLGMVSVSAAFGGFFYLAANQPLVRELKKSHPIISLTAIALSGYLVVYLMDSVLIFMIGILFPIFLVLLHSALRMRSLKNKVMNKLESAGLRTTPMGYFLTEFGHDGDFSL